MRVHRCPPRLKPSRPSTCAIQERAVRVRVRRVAVCWDRQLSRQVLASVASMRTRLATTWTWPSRYGRACDGWPPSGKTRDRSCPSTSRAPQRRKEVLLRRRGPSASRSPRSRRTTCRQSVRPRQGCTTGCSATPRRGEAGPRAPQALLLVRIAFSSHATFAPPQPAPVSKAHTLTSPDSTSNMGAIRCGPCLLGRRQDVPLPSDREVERGVHPRDHASPK